MKTITILSLALSAFLIVKAESDKPVHLFVLSGQSNMAGHGSGDRVHDGGKETF